MQWNMMEAYKTNVGLMLNINIKTIIQDCTNRCK